MESSIRRILVPLDPSVYATAAAETACQVARLHKAQVGGVAVLDSKEIRSSVAPAFGPYYPMMVEVVQEKVHHAANVLSDCLSRFRIVCEKAGVAHFETEYDGLPVPKLLESAIFFDLIVVGLETFFHFETRERKGDSLADLLDRTVTPVLAVPATGMENFRSALITFDGSLGAARAMQDFVRFAAPFDVKVTVLVAERERRQADFLLESASAFLKAHGIESVATEHSDRPIEELVDENYVADFDMIVAGIHSRKHFKDYFVGSFTKKLIEQKMKPLFLSH